MKYKIMGDLEYTTGTEHHRAYRLGISIFTEVNGEKFRGWYCDGYFYPVYSDRNPDTIGYQRYRAEVVK